MTPHLQQALTIARQRHPLRRASAHPPREPMFLQLGVKLPADLYAQVQAAAGSHRMKVAEFVRLALRDKLDAMEGRS